MMPFCGLVEGLEATSASPLAQSFLFSGSGVGARWTSLACSAEDTGTASAQLIALYLQAEETFSFTLMGHSTQALLAA